MGTEKENEVVQYYIVNKELTMSSGKFGAQIAHAATMAAVHGKGDAVFDAWYANSQKKITLCAKEKKMLELEREGFYAVRDNGLTEIPPGSFTVLALPPMTRKEAKPYIKGLQLMKD